MICLLVYFRIPFSAAPDTFIKILEMKSKHAYVIGAAMIIGSATLTIGCTKSTDSDDDLIGNWKRIDDFEGLARSEAVSFTIGEYGYVSTGVASTDRFRDIWQYNTGLRYWTQKADLPGAARSSAVAFAIGEKGYVGTGYDGSANLKDLWEFDPTANQWYQKADFPGSARYDAIGFAVNGKGYIGCGYDGNYLKDFYEFTPGVTGADAGSWAQKASVGGSKRSAAVTFVYNNAAYVMGGNNNGEVQSDLWVYDQAANTWAEKRKIYNYSDETYDDDYGTIPRQNGVAFNIGSYIYISGGEYSSITPTTWRYNPADDSWLEKTAFEGTSRTGAVALSLSGRGFVLTGRSGSLVMDNAYELLPDDEQADND
ncbi:MAG: galactose oxidase [Chitinophagaceae bacterium]|nr:MAG: galactose oxidase [Chitinophagaceae bacterium]